MSTGATTQPTTFGPPFEGFVPYRMPLAQYEAMVASGAFTKRDRLELIEGLLVQKMTKGRKHSAGSEKCWRAIDPRVPAGWHIRIEKPVRIPARESMPEPDVSVARGVPDDYLDLDPGPSDVALVVEVADSSLEADRQLAVTYGARRYSGLLDREHPRPPARGVLQSSRRCVPSSRMAGRVGVGRSDHRRPGGRPDRRGGPTPEAIMNPYDPNNLADPDHPDDVEDLPLEEVDMEASDRALDNIYPPLRAELLAMGVILPEPKAEAAEGGRTDGASDSACAALHRVCGQCCGPVHEPRPRPDR